jgi:hypothetical protein
MTPERPSPLPPLAWNLVLPLAALKILVHALTCNAYGYFRDELYFLDCARHLQWGYVDDAPGIVILHKVALLLGGSLPALRLLAALGGAGTVVVACLMARELGGRRFAQGFAGLCVLAAPIFLGMDSILCVGVLEPMFWVGCAILLARIQRTGNDRLWLGFGALAGAGLLVKYTMGLVLLCFLAAMALTAQRRAFRRAAFWMGAALALLIFLPALLWQVKHAFPLFTDMANIRRIGKNVVLPPLPFLGRQIAFLDPLLLPVWAAGLVALLRRGPRVLGLFYLLLLGSMMALHAKDYYLAAVYPMLFGAGAVAFERNLEARAWSHGRLWPWWR